MWSALSAAGSAAESADANSLRKHKVLDPIVGENLGSKARDLGLIVKAEMSKKRSDLPAGGWPAGWPKAICLKLIAKINEPRHLSETRHVGPKLFHCNFYVAKLEQLGMHGNIGSGRI